MKVFISWSDEQSQSKIVAAALKQLLEDVLKFNPWLSFKDAELGRNWVDQLLEELEETKYGIICLTPENQDSNWMAFEAGALAKNVGEKSFVIPLAIGFEKKEELTSPYKHFQGTFMDKAGIRQIVKQLHRKHNPDGGDVYFEEYIGGDVFDQAWEIFEKSIDSDLLETERRLQIYKNAIKNIGYGYENVEFICNVETDGSATVSKRITVQVVGEVDDLNSTLQFWSQDKKHAVSADLGAKKIEVSDEKRDVRITSDSIISSNLLNLNFEFESDFEPGETFQYVLTEHAGKNTFKLGINGDTRKKEYLGWYIHSPTQHLTMRITFPIGETPAEYDIDVTRGTPSWTPGRNRIKYEVDRIKRNNKDLRSRLIDGRYRLEVKIPSPIQQALYMLSWDPHAGT